ncbi:hypothetical protein ACLM5H_11105 [Fredinandcohnia humi]
MRKFSIGLLYFLVVAACSNSVTKTEELTAKKGKGPETDAQTQILELAHISLEVHGTWSVKKGIDSVAFSIEGKPAGGVDGLGYSESIESTVPNHSEIISKEELPDTSIRAIKVITKTDILEGDSTEETHILFLLEEKNVIYDLHFYSDMISSEEMLRMASSARQI